MTLLSRLALALSLTLAAAPALAQKAYVRNDLLADGQRLEERLKREVATGNRSAADAIRAGEIALGRGDARSALPQANAAVVADSGNAAGWRLMARAANAIEPRDYRERWELRERAVAAAYLAYQRSTNRNDEAASLGVLARTFEKNELWRPALTTYRLSLDLAANPTLQSSYESLREKRGFRLISNKTDSDAASPRACFEFSEALARGRVDFAPYVAISGGKGDFAVSAEDRQICVDGLKHGERYAIVIRQGVPSAIPDETLLKSAYSRHKEAAADDYAVRTMQNLNANPRALATFLGRIAVSKSRGSIFLDHPPTPDRVARINAIAPPQSGGATLLDAAEWKALKSICAGHR